jgi:hypothetical protein
VWLLLTFPTTLRNVAMRGNSSLPPMPSSAKNARLHESGIFPYRCLADYRNRTEALRAQANRDLLRLFASREEQDAERFGRLSPNSQLKRSQ